MGKKLIGLIALLLTLGLGVVAGGAPRAVPEVSRAPGTPTAQAFTPPPVTTAKTSTEDEAWAKVVAAAKNEGKVTVYSLLYTGDIGLGLAEAFYKRYGIRAEMIAGGGAELTERIRTERRTKSVIADVLEGSATYNILLMQGEHLVSIAKELPSLREDVWKVAMDYDGKGYIIVHTGLIMGPWVNTNLVKPEQEPKSWADLLNSQWEGKLLMNDPRTTTMADIPVHLLNKYKLVDADYFAKLARQKLILAGPSPFAPTASLAKGDGAVVVAGTSNTGGQYKAQGAPIKPIVPREGTIGSGHGLSAIEASPHPNAAKVFINFVLSREGHDFESKTLYILPLRKDVEDRSVYAGLQLPRVYMRTIEDDDQISKGFRDGVAAKLLGVR